MPVCTANGDFPQDTGHVVLDWADASVRGFSEPINTKKMASCDVATFTDAMAE